MKLVMVGNGMAGVRTIEELLKRAPDRYDISVFGAEPRPNSNRILRSPVLAGEQTVDDIVLIRSIGRPSSTSPHRSPTRDADVWLQRCLQGTIVKAIREQATTRPRRSKSVTRVDRRVWRGTRCRVMR